MIRKDDAVIAVFGERCSGPGWSNTLYWVLVKRGNRYEVEAVQPDQQTPLMRQLHNISDDVNSRLVREVVTKISGRRAGS